MIRLRAVMDQPRDVLGRFARLDRDAVTLLQELTTESAMELQQRLYQAAPRYKDLPREDQPGRRPGQTIADNIRVTGIKVGGRTGTATIELPPETRFTRPPGIPQHPITPRQGALSFYWFRQGRWFRGRAGQTIQHPGHPVETDWVENALTATEMNLARVMTSRGAITLGLSER